MTQRTCLECGAAFMPQHGVQVCCSDACKKARQERLRAERRRAHTGFDRSPRVCLVCGATFAPRRKNHVCCCTACSKVHSRNSGVAVLEAKRTAKARRRAAFFAERDRAFARAGFTPPKIEVHDGVRVERRGVVPGGCCVGARKGGLV